MGVEEQRRRRENLQEEDERYYHEVLGIVIVTSGRMAHGMLLIYMWLMINQCISPPLKKYIRFYVSPFGRKREFDAKIENMGVFGLRNLN